MQSVGAKGERVHYLSRQLLPLVRMSVDASIADMSRNTCYPGQTGNQSHLGDLDFCGKDMAMVLTFVFSLQKRMGKVNDNL